MSLCEQCLTVPEAAFVTGHSVRGVNHEIDAGIVPADEAGGRAIRGPDLLYLGAMRDLRADLGPELRRRLRAAISAASEARHATASVGHLSVALDAVEKELAGRLRTLRRLQSEDIEHRADVLAGVPVLKGTRIPARHVADLVRQGVASDELAREFDLTLEQVEAAVLFDRVSPRPGRPRKPRRRVPAA